jgi:hypothetical protein
MKVVASTDEYTIYLRRDGRHAIKSSARVSINGDEKVAILLEHGLITAPPPKAAEPEEAPGDEAEASAAEGSEADEGQAEDGSDSEA